MVPAAGLGHDALEGVGQRLERLGLSVSVGSIMSASSTMSGKYTVGE